MRRGLKQSHCHTVVAFAIDGRRRLPDAKGIETQTTRGRPPEPERGGAASPMRRGLKHFLPSGITFFFEPWRRRLPDAKGIETDLQPSFGSWIVAGRRRLPDAKGIETTAVGKLLQNPGTGGAASPMRRGLRRC